MAISAGDARKANGLMRRSVFLAVLLCSRLASAQGLESKLTLAQMTSDADRVVVCVVTAVGAAAALTEDSGDVGIFTPVTCTISRTIKGSTTSTIILQIAGGTTGGYTMKAPNERIPTVGEHLRVFAKSHTASAVVHYHVLNGHHGAITTIE